MTDPIGHTSGREVGVENLVVGGGLDLEAADFLRASIVASVRVDRHQGHPWGCGRRQHHHGAPSERTDLHHSATGGDRAGTIPQASGLPGGHPTLDVGDDGLYLFEAGGGGGGHEVGSVAFHGAGW